MGCHCISKFKVVIIMNGIASSLQHITIAAMIAGCVSIVFEILNEHSFSIDCYNFLATKYELIACVLFLSFMIFQALLTFMTMLHRITVSSITFFQRMKEFFYWCLLSPFVFASIIALGVTFNWIYFDPYPSQCYQFVIVWCFQKSILFSFF